MTCIMYISHLWIFFGALVSSHALDHWNRKCTEVTISASLKSEVFLSCHFNISFDNDTVKWSHFSNGATLLRISHNGRIYFDSPREGRVSVFPLLFKDGNFSILIHDLEPSDIGPYFCEQGSKCRRVEIRESEAEPVERSLDELNPWFYFAAGAGLLILLFIAFSLFSKFCGKHTNGSSKSNPVDGVQSEGNNPPEETQNTESSEQRNRNNRGLRRGFTTVYENDVPAPNQRSAVQQGQHPQRAFRAAPKPTASHPSDEKPYYVNQAELSIPGNAGPKQKKRKKQKHFQFKNPIYGDCSE